MKNVFNQCIFNPDLVKTRWVSGDALDCWVNPGDIVAQIHPQVNNNKVFFSLG